MASARKAASRPAASTTSSASIRLYEHDIRMTADDSVHENADPVQTFKQRFQFKVINRSDERIEFDFIGVDASFANAIRRILIAELPTMAIEHVYVMNNTSIMADEVLAHRLGLIPIKADPRKFEFKRPDEDPTVSNTIVFQLQVKCTRNVNAAPDEMSPDIKYHHSKVLSKDLVWEPQATQSETFAADPIRPVLDDIEIVRLRPDQELELQLYCEKGIGRTHAKWSPVATATYRLMPTIRIKQPAAVSGDKADIFAAFFCPGVIEVVTDKKGVRVPVVKNPRNDSVSREVLRHPEFEDAVELGRDPHHFIFSVESSGILPAPVLLRESILHLMRKIEAVKAALQPPVDEDDEAEE